MLQIKHIWDMKILAVLIKSKLKVNFISDRKLQKP